MNNGEIKHKHMISIPAKMRIGTIGQSYDVQAITQPTSGEHGSEERQGGTEMNLNTNGRRLVTPDLLPVDQILRTNTIVKIELPCSYSLCSFYFGPTLVYDFSTPSGRKPIPDTIPFSEKYSYGTARYILYRGHMDRSHHGYDTEQEHMRCPYNDHDRHDDMGMILYDVKYFDKHGSDYNLGPTIQIIATQGYGLKTFGKGNWFT